MAPMFSPELARPETSGPTPRAWARTATSPCPQSRQPAAALAVLVSVAIQAFYHLYQGVPAALGHGATFLVFSLYYLRTRRIAPVVLAHLYMDVGALILTATRGSA